MANRYWVGGTATWDNQVGTKWSATSGGAGGASVPTTADDVFFDANSTGTVTIGTTNAGAKSINCTGFTGGITATNAITVAGSYTLVAGQTYTGSGPITLTGTGTLTTAGKTIGQLEVNGTGITVTLGDALNIASSNSLLVTNGTFNTAGYNVTAYTLSSTAGGTRTITLSSSTITLSGPTGAINLATTASLTVNANTSQINLTDQSAGATLGGKTLYNVSFTSTSGSGARTIRSTGTFNNLTFTAPASSGYTKVLLLADITVNGTLTCAGASAIRRVSLFSDSLSTSRTVTAAAVSATDCDFRRITIAGAASPISPTRAGNCGNNSGITFPAAKTVYRVGASTTWLGASSWATTSGGAGSDNNFPLAQDTAVIDESTTANITFAAAEGGNIGTVTASSRTTALTLTHNASLPFYGSYTLGSGITVSGAGTMTLQGTGTQTITTAGKTITFPVVVQKSAGTAQLGDAFLSSSTFNSEAGTFTANNYNFTCTTLTSNSGETRTITMGSGLWTLTGSGFVLALTSAGLTFNKNTANILLSDTSSSARTFSGGGLTYNKLTIGGATGTSTLTISGVNTFSELDSTKTVAHTISFADNQSLATWSVTGTSGNVVTVNSSAAGTRRTITLTNATTGIDYMNVKDIGIPTTNTFYVGSNSTDGGNNLNVIFSSPGGAGTGNMFMLFA